MKARRTLRSLGEGGSRLRRISQDTPQLAAGSFICGHYPYAIRHTLMSSAHPRDPLHGITLETIITELVEQYGWAEMGRRVPIRCFLHDPSVKSSLTFLRKTPWARERVEGWYLAYKDI